ncbi:MAG: M23 family metallopeptidase [Firmicutes bacterium]|nr:M23 family metallopeptidase [Bacillota bacterium]
MRNWWHRLMMRLRLKRGLFDGRAQVAAGRWLALVLLLGGVGAVAVWAGEPNEGEGGVNNLLQAAWRQTENWQPTLADNNAAIPDDTAETPTDAEILAETKPPAAAAGQNSNSDNNNEKKVEDKTDEPDVYDHAPEPWLGDEVLQAEADLLQMQMPLVGEELRGFGYGFDATFGDYRFHPGVDIAGAEGAAVVAAFSGEVAELGQDKLQGQFVVLRRGDKLSARYYGLQPQNLMVGQQIDAGEPLGKITAAPVFEDALPPHLHFEIWLDGQAVDPAEYAL